MKRFTKTLLAAVIFSVSVSSAMVADAGCHGRSGGYSSGHNYGSSAYSRISSYPPQSYNSYNYSPPVYVSPPQQAVYPQLAVQPGFQSQYLNQYGATPAPSSTMPVNGFPVGSTGITQPQQQFAQQQPQLTQQQIPQQQIPQPQLQQPTTTQPQAQPLVASGTSAEFSALQALGAFAPPQTEGLQTQQTAANTQPIIGTWTARLSNGAIVQLTLQADRNFHWTATNASGNTSTFQGQYQIDNGSLILNRSSDNQRLTGSTAMNGNDAFSFRLSDSNEASLEFHRS